MTTSVLTFDGTSEQVEFLRDRLGEARRRTLEIIAAISDEDLYRQHDPLMSPIAWDLGHIGNFEELWGVRALPGSGSVHPELDEMYDATKNPRATRDKLPLPDREGLLEYLDSIRSRMLREMERALSEHPAHPLVQDGFVWNMLLQHEYQHNETIAQTLQLKQGDPFSNPVHDLAQPFGGKIVPRWIDVPAGEFEMGTDRRAGVYDNERPKHRVRLDSYQIAAGPVTEGEFAEFIDDGGYRRRELWHDRGWQFIQQEGIGAPKYWERSQKGEWSVRTFDLLREIDHNRPVCHVCWYEAEAFAAWKGARLPTEPEWEKAAAWDSEKGRSRTYPWGDEEPQVKHANLDMRLDGPSQVGSYLTGVSPYGCFQMIGDVWEWTASNFKAYPGFEAFPYDEYSKIFFGDEYRVLRGGSWVTRPGAIRNTFRNWDFPIRRQIYAGFRLARDS